MDLVNYKIKNPENVVLLFLRNTTESYTSSDPVATLILSTNTKYRDTYSNISLKSIYKLSTQDNICRVDNVSLSLFFNKSNGLATSITSATLSRSNRTTLEDSANKVTTISSSSTDTQYPSAAAVYNFVIGTPTFKTFPSTFVTNSTTQDFFDSVYDSNPVDGSVYLGGVTFSDLPTGIGNAEIELYVYPNDVYYAILRSTNVSPYLWQANSHTFRGWEPIDKTAKDYTDAQIGNALQASY